MIDPTTLDGFNICEEYRDFYPTTVWGTDWEQGTEQLVYVAYVNGQEIGIFEDEDGAAEALVYHYRGE